MIATAAGSAPPPRDRRDRRAIGATAARGHDRSSIAPARPRRPGATRAGGASLARSAPQGAMEPDPSPSPSLLARVRWDNVARAAALGLLAALVLAWPHLRAREPALPPAEPVPVAGAAGLQARAGGAEDAGPATRDGARGDEPRAPGGAGAGQDATGRGAVPHPSTAARRGSAAQPGRAAPSPQTAGAGAGTGATTGLTPHGSRARARSRRGATARRRLRPRTGRPPPPPRTVAPAPAPAPAKRPRSTRPPQRPADPPGSRAPEFDWTLG